MSRVTRAAPHELAILLTLAAMQFTHIVDFMIMMPLGPQFMRLFAIDPQHFGFLVSIYTFAAAASGFVAAFRIDRYGRKRALVTMYAGFIVATALCGLAPSYPLLLAARALAGLFGGVVGALIITIVADVVPYARRARGTALVASAFSLAAVLGVPLGLWFANHYSWRAPFLVLAAFSVGMIAIAWRLLPALDANVAHAPRLAPLAQLRAVFGVPTHLRAFAFMIALMMSVFTVVPFIAPYNVMNVGVAEPDLPIIYFAGGLTTLFTAQIIGWLADRYGKRRLFIGLAFASLVPLFTLTHLPRAPLAVAVGVAVVFFVFVPGRFGPATALVTGSVEPRLRGSFMSFNASMQQLGAACASLLAGLIVGRGADGALTRYDWVGFISMGCTLIAIALSRRIHVIPDGSGKVE
ncbi:MAG TPA: MFS transporter [Casimicrobiaceae bacterium]|nr:MFS transporter [Casimicrobiaceae bacterium]